MKTEMQVTWMADRGWGLTYRAEDLKAIRADKKAVAAHEYRDGKLYRTIELARG